MTRGGMVTTRRKGKGEQAKEKEKGRGNSKEVAIRTGAEAPSNQSAVAIGTAGGGWEQEGGRERQQQEREEISMINTRTCRHFFSLLKNLFFMARLIFCLLLFNKCLAITIPVVVQYLALCLIGTPPL